MGDAIATRSRANWPGARNRSGFGTVARAWMVPLERSSALSMKSSVPSRPRFVSSERPISTLLASGPDVCISALKCRLRLGKLDLVRTRIDHEQQVAIVDDLAVLEVDFGQRTADLGAQLDAVDGGELAEETEPAIHRALQGQAHRHRR